MLCSGGGMMDPVDLFNARGREIAQERAAEEAATRGGGRRVAPSDGKLLNGWTMCWAIIGFVLGQLSSQTLVGAFIGALTLGGISLGFQLVLRALGFAVGAGMSGLGALNTTLGAIPQWLVCGAIAGAGCGGAIAFWLDGNTSDLIGPALRLAPIGACVGLLVRVVVLALRRNKTS
jgi:hypothetical protein